MFVLFKVFPRHLHFLEIFSVQFHSPFLIGLFIFLMFRGGVYAFEYPDTENLTNEYLVKIFSHSVAACPLASQLPMLHRASRFHGNAHVGCCVISCTRQVLLTKS